MTAGGPRQSVAVYSGVGKLRKLRLISDPGVKRALYSTPTLSPARRAGTRGEVSP